MRSLFRGPVGHPGRRKRPPSGFSLAKHFVDVLENRVLLSAATSIYPATIPAVMLGPAVETVQAADGNSLSIISQAAPTTMAAYPNTSVLSPSAMLESGSTVTVTLPNSYATGDTVSIAGASPAGFNGTWVVNSSNGSTFAFTDTNTGLGIASKTGTVQKMNDPNLGVITIYNYANTGNSLTGTAGMYSLPGGPRNSGDTTASDEGWSFDLRTSGVGTRSVYNTMTIPQTSGDKVYIFDAWYYIDTNNGGNATPLNDEISIQSSTGKFYDRATNSTTSVSYPVNRWFELREADVQDTVGSTTTVYTWAGVRLAGTAFDNSGWTQLYLGVNNNSLGFSNGTRSQVNGGLDTNSGADGIFVGRYGMPTLMTSTESWGSENAIPSDVYAQVPNQNDPNSAPLTWYFSTANGVATNEGATPTTPLPMTTTLWNVLSTYGGFFYPANTLAGGGDTTFIDASQQSPLMSGESGLTIESNGLNIQPWKNSTINVQNWASVPNGSFTPTPGQSKVYQQTLTGSLFAQRNVVVWEDGEWMNHPNLNNYSSLSALLTAMSSVPGSFYVDSTVTPCVLYMVPFGDTNPNTDGQTYIRSICRSAENGAESGNASAIDIIGADTEMYDVSSTNTCMADYLNGDSLGAYTFSFAGGGNTLANGLYSWGSSKHGIAQVYSGNKPETTTFLNCDVEQGSPYFSQYPYVSYNGNGTYLTADFTQPAVGSSVTIAVNDSSTFLAGETITISGNNSTGGGYYTVQSIVDHNTAIVVNNGNSANSLPGTLITHGGNGNDITVTGSVDSYINCTTNASSGLVGSTTGLTYAAEQASSGASNLATWYGHDNGGGPPFSTINITDCHFDGLISGGVAAQMNITGTTFAGGSLGSNNQTLSNDTIVGAMPTLQGITVAGAPTSMTVTNTSVVYTGDITASYTANRVMYGTETWLNDGIDLRNAYTGGAGVEPNGGAFDKTGTSPVSLSLTNVAFVCPTNENWTVAEGFSIDDSMTLRNNEFQLGPSGWLLNNYNDGGTTANRTLAQAQTLGLDSGSVSGAPSVAYFQVNDGTGQQASMTSLTVAFNEQVTLGTNAITLNMVSAGNSTPVAINLNSQDQGRTWVLTFTANGGVLPGGDYAVTVSAANVVDVIHQSLTGGDQVFGVSSSAPIISINPVSGVYAGGTLSSSGSFVDTDGATSWTATVDYGTGAGEQPLTLNSNQTFSLSAGYSKPGNYTITVVVTDSKHVAGTAKLAVTVGNPAGVTTSSGAVYQISGSPRVVDVVRGTVNLATDLSTVFPGYQLKVETGAVVTLSSNQTVSSLQLIGTGSLDVGSQSVLINYGSAADPIATIRAELGSGYNGGRWGGPGIFSTAARSPKNGVAYSVGYADSADPGNPANLAPHQIEIKYTLVGDLNLDGAVSGPDFALFGAHFNQIVGAWDAGDLFYSGAISGADFAALAANFGQLAT